MDDEWIGMKEEVLQQIEIVISNYGEDNCIVENYIVTEFISALRAERKKVAELKESVCRINKIVMLEDVIK